jgi:hypothetical protein
MLFEARHAFIVVTVPGQAWRLERTGSGELTKTAFNPKDIGHFTAKATVGSGNACWTPNGFENAVLAEFDRLQSSPNLPTYFNDPRRRDYNNSNTFASHLITSVGGTLSGVPLEAYGAFHPFYR